MITHKLDGFDLTIDGNNISAKLNGGDVEIQIKGVKKITALSDGNVVVTSNDIEGLSFQLETLIRIFGAKKCG